MAETYKYSRRKSSRIKKDDPTNAKIKYKMSSKDKSRYSQYESRTPPLPQKCDSSIQDLIKKREILKKELAGLTRNPENDPEYYHKSYKKRKSEEESKIKHHFKRDYSKRVCREYSNTGNLEKYTSDSDDEETLIEESRKRRKELLEKLKDKCNNENKTNGNKNTSEDTDDNLDLEENREKKIVLDQTKTTLKETADMFSEKDDFLNIPENLTQDNNDNTELTDNWDDSDGYYNIKIGESINKNRYTIKSILGQGVFANVIRAQDTTNGNVDVAIKIIRNNDLMYQTGLKEIATLKEVNKADPDGKYHCIKLLNYFMYKRHLCIVMEPMFMDLRAVVRKYGRNHGLNMKALISYSRQLLMGLRILKKVGVIHADIKPDNILVNEKKNILKLCDFGSAAKLEQNEATPYLVSRFYRAPEIILGMPYNHNVDTWSAACTIFEMATGKIMFTGSSNNKMLKCFMDLKGKIPNKLIRKGKFKDQHFNYNNNFLLHSKDEATGREKYVELSNINITRDLEKELRKGCKQVTSLEDRKILQLKNLLDKMLMLDPRQRLSNTDCLKHQFIQDVLEK